MACNRPSTTRSLSSKLKERAAAIDRCKRSRAVGNRMGMSIVGETLTSHGQFAVAEFIRKTTSAPQEKNE